MTMRKLREDPAVNVTPDTYPDPATREVYEALLADGEAEAAAAYLEACRPGYAVITAGYSSPRQQLGAELPGTAPHWSGVFYWPFTKGELVVLIGDAGGREPEDDAHPCQRRPAKWPVKVEWFGGDLAAARARSLEVGWSMAVELREDGTTARVPVVMATCAWCRTTANRAAMEPINHAGSVGCRDTAACQARIAEQARR